MKKAHVARQRLLRLGIFKEVEVLIDTAEGTGWEAGLWIADLRDLIAEVWPLGQVPMPCPTAWTSPLK